jgi:uncharacterized membrane protein YccC
VVVGQNKRELAEMGPELKQACQTLIEVMKTLDDIVKLRNTSDRQEIAQETLAMLTTLQQQVQDLKKKFRIGSNSPETITPNLHKLILILNNLAEQIDATITLLLDHQKQVKIARPSVPLTPVTPFWEILKNNWTFESINFTAAIRLATVTTFAMLVSILLHWHHGYWIALTVLFVLQPDYGGTIQKAIQRIGGTILGVILVTPIVLQIQALNLLIIIPIILAALTAAFRFVNYAFFMLFLTMLIVLILDLDVPKDWQLAIGGLAIGRLAPESGEIENLEILFFSKRLESQTQFELLLEENLKMTEPLTAGLLVTLAVQDFVNSGTGDLAKRFITEALAKIPVLW